MIATLPRPKTVVERLTWHANLLHELFKAHIELECCEDDLCELALDLQTEADAMGRRVAMTEGREVMW